MRKTIFISCFAFLAMMVSCLFFTSCDKNSGENKELVGTWIENHGRYDSGWKFRSNGKCSMENGARMAAS